MKNKIHKEKNFSFILTEDNLNKLNKFIEKNYKKVVYSINTIDDVEVELSFNELLSYDNYNSEKIIGIKIECHKKQNKNYDDYFFLWDDSIEISFWDNRSYKSIFEYESINYTIKSTNTKEFNEIKKWLHKILENDFKSSYDFFTKRIIFNIINFFPYFFIIIYLTYKEVRILELEQQIFIIFWYIFIIGFFINMPFYKKIYNLFFPKIIFWIWKQKDLIEIRKDYRKNLLWTIIIWWIILPLITYLFST